MTWDGPFIGYPSEPVSACTDGCISPHPQSPLAWLDFRGNAPGEFHGSFEIPQGNALRVTGAGAITTLNVAGANRKVQGGGTLYNPLIAGTGATLAPGDQIGVLTLAQDLELRGGSVLDWEFADSHDLLSGQGVLRLSGTVDTPIHIQIHDLSNAATPLNSSSDRAWTLATATNVLGFDPSAFQINTSLVTTSFLGRFFVSLDASSVLLHYEVPLIGDLNGDRFVDAADAGMMFANWETNGVGDLNGDNANCG